MMGMGGMGGMGNGMMPRAMAAASSPPVDTAKAEAELKKEQLVKALEAASEELAHKSRSGQLSTPNMPRKEDAEPKKDDAKAEGEEQEKLSIRCHLHKKPNSKCKFCQKVEASTIGSKASGAKDGEVEKEKPAGKAEQSETSKEDEDYSRRTFNCSPMLKDQIFASSYFKSLLSINTIEDLIEEIVTYADTLDVYNAGSNNSPSCFICHAYRLFTLPQAEDLSEVGSILDHTANAVVRCVGFIYLRFVTNPTYLWGKFEDHLFDDQELTYANAGKQVTTTIGEYVEGLLVRDKYFNTPLPRIPVKVKQMLEKELAPLPQYRKRMEANRKIFRGKTVTDMPVEVIIDGRWVSGLAKELLGRPSAARKVRVRIDEGSDINVHLGKVVLKSESHSGSESGDERSGKKRRRSRSPDWSRFKGESQQDMVDELRKRAKEEATIGHGDSRAYQKRPVRDDMALATKFERGIHGAQMLEQDNRSGASHQSRPRGSEREDTAVSESTIRRRREEEAERQKKMQEIYQKYGAAKTSSASKKSDDFDHPDVLRLG
mmetsp:Transcript_86929/g.245189  ORF Transcript_86929/g.245189 Transcript_86929/m.245189 type:complete len:545 (+) Transcript_86929:2-1636(+)